MSRSGANLSATYATASNLGLIQASPVYAAPGPVVTFVDDDGDPHWNDIWAVILADRPDVRISVAVIAGQVSGANPSPSYPSLNVAQVQAIKDAGHDILCHTWAHLDCNTSTPAALQDDWSHGQQWMRDNGFAEHADVLVYPGGLTPTDATRKAVARDLFRCCVNTATTNTYNPDPVDSWSIQRVNGDTLTQAQLTAQVDAAKANNAWLIVMTHDLQLYNAGAAASIAKIEAVIDYCGTVGVPIMKFSDAEAQRGNVIAIGERSLPNSLFVSRMGKKNWGWQQGSWTPTLYGSTTAGSHTYTQQKGYFQVAGGMVTVKASISIASAGLDPTMAGNLRIGGLPLQPSSLDVAGVAPCEFNIFNLGTGYTGVWAKTTAGTYLNLLVDGNNVAEKFLTSAAVVSGQTLNLAFVMTYMIPDPAWS